MLAKNEEKSKNAKMHEGFVNFIFKSITAWNTLYHSKLLLSVITNHDIMKLCIRRKKPQTTAVQSNFKKSNWKSKKTKTGEHIIPGK